MSVQRFDITSEGEHHLLAALTIAMDEMKSWNGAKPTSYPVRSWLIEEISKDHKTPWSPDYKAMTFGHTGTPFPVPITKEQLVTMIMTWLETQDYGRAPDTDGDTHKGWRVFSNDPWSSFSVSPAWLVYGK